MTEGCDKAVTVTGTSCAGGAAPTRKRGAALEQAILDAAYAELTDVGYTAFSVEGVAARARTGKASIYRRWPTRQLLLLDALHTGLPQVDVVVQSDLVEGLTTAEALRVVARSMNDALGSPVGDAIRAITFEAAVDPVLAQLVDERFQQPRVAAMAALLQRGVTRGEVRPDAVTPLIAEVLPIMIMHRVMLTRHALSAADVEAIIGQVVLPLIEPRP